MKILLIKTSSLGDVIHILPALSDAQKAIPNIQFDWVIETAFQEVPGWHSAVEKTILFSLRKWRKNIFEKNTWKEIKSFFHVLREKNYDLVIDAQGLIKSALLTKFAKGPCGGLDSHSAWESIAAIAYQKKVSVDPHQHAVIRMRQLLAKLLNYDEKKYELDYGLEKLKNFAAVPSSVLFIHGTTWKTKHWPEDYWIQLAKQIVQTGLKINLPWGNEEERTRAERIANISSQIEVLPKLSLTEIAQHLLQAKAVVSVDTGLGHLAAALSVPTISLYGPTDALLTGTMGLNQKHLQAVFPCSPCLKSYCTYQGPHPVEPPCFGTIPPEKVFETLQKILF